MATRRDPKSDGLRERYGAWAVVTGASDGIGREFAWELARSGVAVVLAARRRERLDELAASLRETCGVETRVCAVNLATSHGVDELLAHVAELDVGLFIAAAGFGTSGAFIDATVDDELGMIDVNCRAVAALSHAFGKRFADQRRGGLVLLSSLLAFQGVPRAANYAATKAYVQTLAEGLRLELAPFDVDVIASAPGPVATGFAARADMVMGLSLPARAVARTTLDALGKTTTVRPGWLSKLLEASLALLPRWGRVRIMKIVMGAMTRHQALPPASNTTVHGP